jgi:zinc transporter ZupT
MLLGVENKNMRYHGLSLWDMMEIGVPLVFVALTFFSTLAGGLVVLRSKRIDIKYFYAFAAGALIGVSFFDLFPQIIELIGNGVDSTAVMVTIVAAFFFFHILDRTFVIHSMHDHSEENRGRSMRMNGMVRAAGLCIHSLLDGVAIGTAFHVNFSFGIVIGFAVIFHDFSDGLNTVTVMRRAGSGSRLSLGWLLVDSVTPVIGALATLAFTLSQDALAIMLGFFIGEFLFIGMADLLPEAHSKGTSYKVVLASVLGVLLIFALTRFLSI